MFRFTIRDILWLTVVVAVAVCWYKDRKWMVTSVAKATSDLVVQRADDKAKLKREMARLAFLDKKRQMVADNFSQLLKGINEAHEKEVVRLSKRIYQLEGPGYADKVEPTEVAGMGIEWWADRANYFERRFRGAEKREAERLASETKKGGN